MARKKQIAVQNATVEVDGSVANSVAQSTAAVKSSVKAGRQRASSTAHAASASALKALHQATPSSASLPSKEDGQRLLERAGRSVGGIAVALALSYAISAGLYTAAASVTGVELALVSRSLNESWQVLAVLGWRTFELIVAWYLSYDYIDIASLTIVSHAPYFLLLVSCYGVRARTAVLCLAIDIAAASLPLRLLRPQSPAHKRAPATTSRRGAGARAAPGHLLDRPLQIEASLLAAAMYAAAALFATRTFLPQLLVLHFDQLRTLDRVYDAQLPLVLAATLPVGWAARDFIFSAASTATAAAAAAAAAATSTSIVPIGASAGLKTSAKSQHAGLDGVATQVEEFDPVTATLGSTVQHNLAFWAGLSPRSRLVALRTVVLALFCAGNTYVRTYAGVEGADKVGAAGWASLWTVASLIVGAVFYWVGDV